MRYYNSIKQFKFKTQYLDIINLVYKMCSNLCPNNKEYFRFFFKHELFDIIINVKESEKLLRIKHENKHVDIFLSGYEFSCNLTTDSNEKLNNYKLEKEIYSSFRSLYNALLTVEVHKIRTRNCKLFTQKELLEVLRVGYPTITRVAQSEHSLERQAYYSLSFVGYLGNSFNDNTYAVYQHPRNIIDSVEKDGKTLTVELTNSKNKVYVEDEYGVFTKINPLMY